MADYKTGVVTTQNTSTGATNPNQIRRTYTLPGKLLERKKHLLPLYWALTERSQKIPVDDPDPKYTEDSYEIYQGTLKGATAAGADTALLVATEYLTIPDGMNRYVEGNLLHIMPHQTSQTNTNFKFQGEIVRVIERISTNVLKVQRNIGETVTTFNATAESGDTLNFERIMSSHAEGGRSPDVTSHAIESRQARIQIAKTAWSVTETLNQTKLYYGSEMSRQSKIKTDAFMMDIEKSAWNGRQSTVSEAGAERRTSGGYVDFIISGDGDNTMSAAFTGTPTSVGNDMVRGTATGTDRSRVWQVVNKTQFTLSEFYKFIQRNFEHGKANRKPFFVGSDLYRIASNLLDPKVQYGPSQSWYGLTMKELRFGGKTLMLVHDPVLENEMSYWGAVVDVDYAFYAYMRDIMVQPGIQGNDEDKVKNQLLAEIGWMWKYHAAHSLLIMSPTVGSTIVI
jgi:hypothetical protein